jgi:hypothetical protein
MPFEKNGIFFKRISTAIRAKKRVLLKKVSKNPKLKET